MKTWEQKDEVKRNNPSVCHAENMAYNTEIWIVSIEFTLYLYVPSIQRNEYSYKDWIWVMSS